MTTNNNDGVVANYNILNWYEYQGKSCENKTLDYLAYPITGVLGGHTIKVETGEEKATSCGTLVTLIVLSILLLPLVLTVSLTAYLIKLCSSEKATIAQIADLHFNQNSEPQLLLGQTYHEINQFEFTNNPFFNENKRYIYETIKQKHLSHNEEGTSAPTKKMDVIITKYALNDLNELFNKPIFGDLLISTVTATQGDQFRIQFNFPNVLKCDGEFTYPNSSEIETLVHWTANFADSNLFGFFAGSLLAQDELQVVEHPGLAHLKNKPEFQNASQLAKNEVALVEAERYCHLNTTKKVSIGTERKTLYGNNFAIASKAAIDECLTIFDDPQKSHIFAMAAPHIPASLAGKPYQIEHIRQLLLTAITAFKAIKAHLEDDEKKACIHTGNWGAGAFGNDPTMVAIIQIAAGAFAEVDEIRYYPMNSQDAFENAKLILKQINTNYPDLTVEEFCQYLASHAEFYNLRYGLGNGT